MFKCSLDCHQCCVRRDYHREPNKWTITKDGREIAGYPYLGKRGTELLPSEVRRINRLAHKLRRRVDDNGEPIQYQIYPSTAITPVDQKHPPTTQQIDAYQLMGRTVEGDICPFLSTLTEGIYVKNSEGEKTNTLACLIYKDRPLMCKAYPLSALYFTIKKGFKIQYARIHMGCDWVGRQITEKGVNWLRLENQPFPISWIKRLNYEAMIRIQKGKYSGLKNTTLWRYATGIGLKTDKDELMPPQWMNWGWM